MDVFPLRLLAHQCPAPGSGSSSSGRWQASSAFARNERRKAILKKAQTHGSSRFARLRELWWGGAWGGNGLILASDSGAMSASTVRAMFSLSPGRAAARVPRSLCPRSCQQSAKACLSSIRRPKILPSRSVNAGGMARCGHWISFSRPCPTASPPRHGTRPRCR